MSRTIDDIKSSVARLTADMEAVAKAAYDKGYLDGLSTDRPTQEQFDKDHAEVQAYGEDQNLLILAGKYDRDEAVEKFTAYLKKEWDWDDEQAEWAENETKGSSVSYELHEGEHVYYIRADRGGIYDCWLCEVDV